MTDSEERTTSQKAVLVVDDNETARWLLAEILAGEGYAVSEAGNADEALARLATDSGVQAVISDIEMPGSMDGVEMAALIQRKQPEIAVLLTSGRHYPGADALPPATRFIAKPWAPDDLLRELESLLS